MPYFEPSRPRPDSFTPPKGATSVEMSPALMPDDAVLERLGHPPDAADVTGVEVGGQPEFGVVGHADRLGFGLEPEQRRERARRSPRGRPASSEVTSARIVGSKKVPPSACRLPPTTTRAPLARASAMCSSTFAPPPRRSAGPARDALASAVADLEPAHARRELLGEGVVDAVLHQDAVGADAGLAGCCGTWRPWPPARRRPGPRRRRR